MTTSTGGLPINTARTAIFWRSVWKEDGDVRAHLGNQALLLRDIELRRGAGVEPLLDQRENPVGYIEIVPRNPQPVLRRKHLEIGIADGYDGRENDDFLVEAAG